MISRMLGALDGTHALRATPRPGIAARLSRASTAEVVARSTSTPGPHNRPRPIGLVGEIANSAAPASAARLRALAICTLKTTGAGFGQ